MLCLCPSAALAQRESMRTTAHCLRSPAALERRLSGGVRMLLCGGGGGRYAGLGAGLGEIPAASAGMTDLFRTGVAECCAGMTELLHGAAELRAGMDHPSALPPRPGPAFSRRG